MQKNQVSHQRVRATRACLAATTAIASLWGGIASAQAQEAQPGEIVVTATKRETTLQDVPAALAAVGGERLETERVLNIEQLRSIPSFSAGTAFGRDQNQYFVRGVTTYNGNEGTSSAVAIYQNEVFTDSPSFGSEPFFDVERVEVLFGPQGTLWGQNSTGGAVNVITKKPTKDFEGAVSITYGAFNEFDIDGAISGPLVDDKLSARLSFVHQSRDGWITNVFNNKKIAGYSDSAVRAQLLWTPSDTFDLLLRFRARELSGDGATPYFGTGLLPGNTNIYGYQYSDSYDTLSINVTDPVNDLNSHGASLEANLDLGFAGLKFIASHDKSDGESRFDDDATPLDIETFHNEKSAEQQNLELRLTSPESDHFSWIVGATYFKGRSELDQQFYTLAQDPMIGSGLYGYGIRFNQSKRNYGIYGSVTFHLTDGLSVITGGRYTSEKISGNIDNVMYLINLASPEDVDSSQDPLIPLATLSQKISSREPTGDITLQYKPSSELNFYAKVARGYRGGGFNQGAFSQDAAVSVRPEYVWSYEAGAKTVWLDGKLAIDLSIFRSDFSDLQSQSYTNNVLTLFNAGKANYTGGELNINYRPSRDFNVRLGYSFVQRHVYGYQGVGPDGLVYDVDYDRPYSQANIGIMKAFDLGSDHRLVFNTSWTYFGRRYLRDIIPSDPIWRFLQQDPRWKGDASVSYEFGNGRWALTGWVKNITDQKSYSSPAPQPYYGLSVITHGDPRTYGATLNVEF